MKFRIPSKSKLNDLNEGTTIHRLSTTATFHLRIKSL